MTNSRSVLLTRAVLVVAGATLVVGSAGHLAKSWLIETQSHLIGVLSPSPAPTVTSQREASETAANAPHPTGDATSPSMPSALQAPRPTPWASTQRDDTARIPRPDTPPDTRRAAERAAAIPGARVVAGLPSADIALIR